MKSNKKKPKPNLGKVQKNNPTKEPISKQNQKNLNGNKKGIQKQIKKQSEKIQTQIPKTKKLHRHRNKTPNDIERTTKRENAKPKS